VDARWLVELINESPYAGDGKVSRHYPRELRLDRDGNYRASSRHGVLCTAEGLNESLLLSTAGGATGVHEHSLLLVEDACLVAVGPHMVCLSLPHLELQWSREADDATCFGIHLAPDGRSLISHGEMTIARISLAGDSIWRVGGADIFTGDFSVHASFVRAEDFYGTVYRFDLETGRALG
jgi:hypothetical protein